MKFKKSKSELIWDKFVILAKFQQNYDRTSTYWKKN